MATTAFDEERELLETLAVMARVPKRFVDETLWPEFQQINSELGRYLNAITDRVIQAAIFADDSDAETRAAPATLPEGSFTLEG